MTFRIPSDGDGDKPTTTEAYTLASRVLDGLQPEIRLLTEHSNIRHDRGVTVELFILGQIMSTILNEGAGKIVGVRDTLKRLPKTIKQQIGAQRRTGSDFSERQIQNTFELITAVLSAGLILEPHNHPITHTAKGVQHPCPIDCPYLPLDQDWYMNAFARASCLDARITGTSALDATDEESYSTPVWSDSDTADEVTDPDDEDDPPKPTPKTKGKKDNQEREEVPGTWFVLGPDERKITSKDSDARLARRTASVGESEFYNGFQIFGTTNLAADPDDNAPPLITGTNLISAGDHHGCAGAEAIRRSQLNFGNVEHTLPDRGFTAKAYDLFQKPLDDANITVTKDLTSTQRQPRDRALLPRSGGVIEFYDGWYWADSVPTKPPGGWPKNLPKHLRKDLKNIPRWGIGTPLALRLAIHEQFDERDPYAFRVDKHYKTAGKTRLKGPAIDGHVRCINNPKTYKKPSKKTRPVTNCIKGVPCSCGATIVIATDRLRAATQPEPHFGTTAWSSIYDLRSTVERTFSRIKRVVTDINRSTIRVLGIVKTGIMWAGFIAAHNLHAVLHWRHQNGIPDPILAAHTKHNPSKTAVPEAVTETVTAAIQRRTAYLAATRNHPTGRRGIRRTYARAWILALPDKFRDRRLT